MFRLHCRLIDTFKRPKQIQSKYERFISLQNWWHSRSFSNCENVGGRFRTYDEVLNSRQLQARRSILVQVNSDKSYNELYRYCSQFGAINSAFHYKNGESMQRILIEFDSEDGARNTLNSSIFDEPQVPAHSRFLWFRAAKDKSPPKAEIGADAIPPLNIVNGIEQMSAQQLTELLRQQPTIDEQIQTLYRCTSIDDLGYRLRFMAAVQIEDCVRAMFPRARVHPFGSSVNGFGRIGSDLDMNLNLLPQGDVGQDDRRLVFHTRSCLQNERSVSQRYLSIIADLIHNVLPGISTVNAILQARVPIIRYDHAYLSMQVDLSMHNMSAIYMSELLFLFGELDRRIRPLMFCIRHWARSTGITHPHPGNWISNFGLTCLVIFYLQQLKEPLLPSLNQLISSGRPGDARMVEAQKVEFLRDFNLLDFKSTNTQTLQQLLIEFFQFYCRFDFEGQALSLHSTAEVPKNELATMYFVNPIEPHLNVTKNVSEKECTRLQTGCGTAWQVLEAEMEKGRANGQHTWGILKMFQDPRVPQAASNHSVPVRDSDSTALSLARGVIKRSVQTNYTGLLNVQSLYVHKTADTKPNARRPTKIGDARVKQVVAQITKKSNSTPQSQPVRNINGDRENAASTKRVTNRTKKKIIPTE